MNEKLKKLVRFNKTMGFLHFIQAVIMVFLATSVIQNIKEFQPPIMQSYLTYNPVTQSLEPATKELFTLPFGILVSSFLFISALAHFIIVLKKDKYMEDLKKGINRFRWYEYALSSSIMVVLIATLFGVYELSTLLLIFFINALMNIFGLIMEEKNMNSDKVDWTPFIYGSIAGILPWVVILIYMFTNGNFDLVPWFVWAIVATYFIFFNTFPVNMILQYKKTGKWKDYLYGERVYIILSLVAKTTLAWLVLFGAMQP
ncbi:MAG: heliorhodopsin HeR [Bacilli bacterium]|nr:heliorhodopsin HeR [Bacilli bacterium]MDD4808504.1 heliorhodopsin HeR [Bacilli bacterium]